jgi:UDP-2,3-diacylglucosamine pyrophosphatase LpxH
MIYVISDLHLGNKGTRDNFFARGLDRFYRFLDYVGSNELVIAGDAFEWFQCNLSESVMAYRELLERLGCHSGVRWIYGNHDASFTKFLGTGIRLVGINLPRYGLAFESTIGGKRFAFAHGHEFDSSCSSLNPGLGEVTAVLSGMLEDRNNGPNKAGHAIEDNFISALEAPLNLWRHLTLASGRDKEMLDNAELYRIQQKADYLIFGHTHNQGRFGNCVNCGCWVRNRDGFTKIDDDGNVTMWTWNEDHAEEFK